MSLVLDSSMTLAWYFEDEKTEEKHGGSASGGGGRGRRPGALAARSASLADLRSLSIAIDRGTNRAAWAATRQLCDRFGLTAYDAAYLELAARRRLPLATLDGDLVRAARAQNVPLVGALR